jgi:CheY-specific phosphatase CheX
MTSTTRSPLLAAATTTFESLALLLPSADLTSAEAAGAQAYGVCVRFSGPLCGYLALRVTDDVARAFVENMLGVDDADAPLVRDALGEVANVVCGNLLPGLAGREAVFHLSAPEPLDAADASWASASAAAPALATSLGVDGGRADVALHLDPATPLPAAP